MDNVEERQGVKLGGPPRQSRETLCTQDREGPRQPRQRVAAESLLSSPIPPMQFPDFERSRRQQTATPGSREQHDTVGSLRVTKRHRKLLKTSPMLSLQPPNSNSNNNNSNSASSPAVSSPSSSSSSSGSSRLPPESWSRLSGVLEARRQLMKEMCAKYKSSISRTITHHHVANIFVEDKYKLLYCQVPKAGCSNWKRTLMVLAGQAPDTRSIKHDAVHYGNHLRRLDGFDREGITRRLEAYAKVVFVREPLERLVSAYRDKFENPNGYYHSLFGKPIIAKYRANASRTALATGSGVTFQEFVRYLLDVHRPVGMDIHWEPANQLCNPCLLDYDFIGKFEHMEEESDFLLRRTGAPRNLTLPDFKDRNPGAERTSVRLTQKYFARVSAWERQRIYDFYYMDYLMFNYSKPFKDLY